MELRISAETVTELREKLLSFADVFGALTPAGEKQIFSSPPQPAAQTPIESRVSVSTVESPKVARATSQPASDTPAAQPKKRGRKPGYKVKSAAAQPPETQLKLDLDRVTDSSSAAPTDEAPAPTPPTKADAAAALNELADKKDYATAKAMVERFGAQSLSGIDPNRYQEFIDECKSAAQS